VFNPQTSKLRCESMQQLDDTPTEQSMIENIDGSVSQWNPSV